MRFEVVSVGDSTLAFLAPGLAWVAPGAQGIAVDPRRRDVLVARFAVVARRADTALAVVTGQTMRPTLDHVALLMRPAPPAPRRRGPFLTGLGIGGALGVLAGLLVR